MRKVQAHMARIQVNSFVRDGLLRVRVTPSSSSNRLLCVAGDGVLKIAIAAPPEDNKANKELLSFLKKECGLNCAIVKGATSREKVLRCKTV